MTGGVAAVQARIAEIRAYVEPAAAVAVASTSSATASSASSATSASGSPTAGTDFAAALAQLTGTAGADLGTVPENALSTTVTGQDLVEAAKKYLGTPYVWGGESLAEGGLDCSGLVLRSLADLGITSGVPRVARDQATLGEPVPSLSQALPGDLVVLNGGKHIGIYVGDGKMIDAPKPGKSVTIRDVYAEPTTIRRVLPQAAATPTAGTASTALSSALAGTAAGQNALALLTGSAGSTAASGAAGSLTQALGALGSGSAGAGTSTSSLLTSLWGAAS